MRTVYCFASWSTPSYLSPMNYLLFGVPQGQELIVIFIIVLLLFGAKKIPELARGLGKSMGEFKKARQEFEDEIKLAAEDAEKDHEADAPVKSEPHKS